MNAELKKFYSNKSNADRAGKAKFGANNYTVNEVEGEGWEVKYLAPAEEYQTIGGIPVTHESVIHRPCKQVWHIADAMPGAKRKEVLEACVKAGIAYYTARTQYQQWAACQKEMAQRQVNPQGPKVYKD